MTTPSRPPRAPRPKIQLPDLPDYAQDEMGRRLCAVVLEDGRHCCRRHRSSGRCSRCYAREYAAELRRIEGREAAVKLDDPVKVTAYLPAPLLAQVAERLPGETSDSARIRRALVTWVDSTPILAPGQPLASRYRGLPVRVRRASSPAAPREASMEYLNCTPHPVVIYAADSKTVLATIPPSQWTIRVQTPPQRVLEPVQINGASVPVVTAQDFEAGEVTGIPPCDDLQQESTALIVGVIGAGRVDRLWGGPVYVTDTGPESVVRDPSGRILGVRRLQRAR